LSADAARSRRGRSRRRRVQALLSEAAIGARTVAEAVGVHGKGDLGQLVPALLALGALATLIAVVAAVLALSLSSSGSGSSGVQIDHPVTAKTVAPAPHYLVGGRF
jgi:hypothetical protein